MKVSFEAASLTQAGIRAFVEQAAEFMAEAGLASEKVTGDSPEYAIRRWVEVLQTEALRCAKFKRTERLKKLSSMEALLDD